MTPGENGTRAFGVYPKAATKEFVVQETGDELLVYNLPENRAICLNQTAALVWKNCNGKNDIGKIMENVEKTLKSPISEDLILFALNQLKDEGLILNGQSIPNGFDGLSRREIVKKVGFGSLVALPIVSALIAPTSANAQSVFPPCVGPGSVLPGAMGSTCSASPPVSVCQNVCNNSCCSGSGTLSGVPCNTGPATGCTCTCNPF